MNEDEITHVGASEVTHVETGVDHFGGPIDHFGGPIDHFDGLREMRDGILRADDNRAAMEQAQDFEGLANGAADLAVIIGDLQALQRATRFGLARILIDRHEREGGNPRRRPAVEVEGLGKVDVPSGNERKNWESQKLLADLLNSILAAGEFGTPADLIEQVYDMLVEVLPFTASTSWKKGTFDPATETWTGLRGQGIDLDRYSDEVAKDRLADIPKRASS